MRLCLKFQGREGKFCLTVILGTQGHFQAVKDSFFVTFPTF